MELTDSQLEIVAAAAIVLALVATVVAALALAGQRRARRAYAVFSGGRREDVLSLLERHIEEVASLRDETASLRAFADELRELDRRAISRTSMVRYDAFDDMGGHLSFSAALLDERGDGLVVSAINGRTDTRVYAKPIERGESRHNLSQEESSVIARALTPSERDQEGRARRSRRGERGRSQRTGRASDAQPVERP